MITTRHRARLDTLPKRWPTFADTLVDPVIERTLTPSPHDVRPAPIEKVPAGRLVQSAYNQGLATAEAVIHDYLFAHFDDDKATAHFAHIQVRLNKERR